MYNIYIYIYIYIYLYIHIIYICIVKICVMLVKRKHHIDETCFLHCPIKATNYRALILENIDEVSATGYIQNESGSAYGPRRPGRPYIYIYIYIYVYIF